MKLTVIIAIVALLLGTSGHCVFALENIYRPPFATQSQSAQGPVVPRAEQPTVRHRLPADPIVGQTGPSSHPQQLHGWLIPDTPKSRRLGITSGVTIFDAEKAGLVLCNDPHTISLVGGDWRPPQAGVDSMLRQRNHTDEQTICLVICNLPAQPLLKSMLEQQGITVLRYHPHNAYSVRGPVERVAGLAKLDAVHWVGYLPPDAKQHPRWRSLRHDQKHKLAVAVYDKSQLGSTAQQCAEIGLADVFQEPFSGQVYGYGYTSLVSRLTNLENVMFVQPVSQARATLSHSVSYCGEHPLIRRDFTFDENVVVGFIDSGFALNHVAFMGQSGYPALNAVGWNVSGQGTDANTFEDPDRHGTAIGGIMLSRWYDQNLEGMCPRAGADPNLSVRVVRCGRSDDDGLIFYNVEQAMALLAIDYQSEVINNSWSIADDNTGTDALSCTADSIVWASGQVMIFGAGNDGPSPGSIDSPAAAKNTIAVGNVANNRSWELQDDSSRGPTFDGRTKPDIYAPGRVVTTPDGTNQQGAVGWSGTSMSAPHVAGLAASLIGQYPYNENPEVFQLSGFPAVVKALLMATARRQPHLPEHTGIANSLEAHFLTENVGGIQFGPFYGDPRQYDWVYWDFNVPPNMGELLAILTWIEPEAAPGAGTAVYNNYDLYLDFGATSPDWSGEYSSTNLVDNVEFIRVLNPPAGVVRVKARKISAPTDLRLAAAVQTRVKPGGGDRYEPNNSAQQATPLSPGIYGELLALDDDWYALNVPSHQEITVTISFTNRFGNLDLELYDTNGTSLLGQSATDNDDETVVYANNSAATKTIYAKVFGRDEWTNEYELRISLGTISASPTPTAMPDTPTPVSTPTNTPTPLVLDCALYDLNGDGVVDYHDLMLILGCWHYGL